MIQVRNLTFAYAHSQPVFLDFNWNVERGETWAILGPSGCGKTTLLYLLAGLRFPDSGQILIDDQLLTRPRPQTGLILQEYGLLPWATVRQNAELGLRIRDFYGPDGKHGPSIIDQNGGAYKWLERLGLASIQDKYIHQVSGGQRQRTAIARTLATDPDLLLMDEAFSSLDALTRESLQNLTLELQAEQNLTLVIVTHAIEEAAVMGRKILLLGQPPNTRAAIFDNPGMAEKGFRSSQEYLELCRSLRSRMEDGRTVP